MANDLAEIIRINFLAQIAKAARNSDGSYDLDKTKIFEKKLYREIAILTHPDRNPGDKYMEELFKQLGEVHERFEKANGSVAEWLKLAQLPEFGGSKNAELEALVDQAADAVEAHIAAKMAVEKRLAQALADIVNLRRGSQFKPEQIELYVHPDPRENIRITLANYQTEIPRLLRNGTTDPTLVDRLHQAERAATSYQQQASQAQAREQNLQRQLIEQTSRATGYERQLTDAQKEHKKYQTENAELQQKHRRALAALGEQQEARTRLEQLLEMTRDAGTALLKAKLDENKTMYERKISAYKEALECNVDLTEIILKQKAEETQNNSAWLMLANYVTIKNASTNEQSEERSNFARYCIYKALETGDNTTSNYLLNIGKTLTQANLLGYAEQITTEVLKREPENQHALALQSIIISKETADNLSLNHERTQYLQCCTYKAVETGNQEVIEQLLSFGQDLLSRGKYQIAETIFDEIRKAQPRNREAWKLLGQTIDSSPTRQLFERQEWRRYCEYQSQTN